MMMVQRLAFSVQGYCFFWHSGVLICCCLLVGGCMSSKGTEMTEEEFSVFMADWLGEEASCEANEDELYLLCQSPLSVMDQMPSIRFFTFDVKAGKTTFEGEVAGGPVRWSDTYIVTAQQSVGAMQRDASSGTSPLLIDARTGEQR